MATGIADVTALYAARHGEPDLASSAPPKAEDASSIELSSPETVARTIARRARVRVFATLAPLAFLVGVLLVVVGRVGL